jgi:hypothetical protein
MAASLPTENFKDARRLTEYLAPFKQLVDSCAMCKTGLADCVLLSRIQALPLPRHPAQGTWFVVPIRSR